MRRLFLKYFKEILFFILLGIFFRFVELVFIPVFFGVPASFVSSEFVGMLYDVVVVGTILLMAFPVYYLGSLLLKRVTHFVFGSILLLLTVVHLLILMYFFYQLLPLDIFLYQYSLSEIFFTVTTSGISVWKFIIAFVLTIVVVVLLRRFLNRKELSLKGVMSCSLFFVVGAVIIFLLGISNTTFNRFSKNKTLYFITQSVNYYFQKTNTIPFIYTNEDALTYQALYPDKKYISTEYPYLHKFGGQEDNVLTSFFEPFDTTPNIVILIVEGFNDDYLYSYRSVDLMPKLKSLCNQSLYWKKCFTSGERSFAVVPSVLGSLPYGNKGFTLLETLPRHSSLVSILAADGYQTNFFYGQGRWFHQKGRFFRYNQTDIIFDKKNFSEKYQKIVVGDDDYFWGYDDKDLFNQSLEVLDTLNSKSHFDVYFTGTSHSPFVISDENEYDDRLDSLKNKLVNDEDASFFETNRKFLRSLLFVDDAIDEFITNYKKRDDYSNTIFFITGDHPMTELPRTNLLKRYHVPLMVYSSKIKKPKIFTQVVSHLDVNKSLISLLETYRGRKIRVSSAMGNVLNVSDTARSKRIAFMNDNREVIDYYANGYFISGQHLFRVENDLSLVEIYDDELFNQMEEELSSINKTMLYACNQNKIIPDSTYCKHLNYPLIVSIDQETEREYKQEYHDLITSTEVKNQDFVFDVSFNYSGDFGKDISLVYQLSDHSGENIVWKELKFASESGHYQTHISIPKQVTNDSTLFFASYFWNKKKQSMQYKNMKVLLHEIH